MDFLGPLLKHVLVRPGIAILLAVGTGMFITSTVIRLVYWTRDWIVGAFLTLWATAKSNAQLLFSIVKWILYFAVAAALGLYVSLDYWAQNETVLDWVADKLAQFHWIPAAVLRTCADFLSPAAVNVTGVGVNG
jgi:hypothetical protein